MSTLGALKAEIADDIARTDLTAQIASAITAAINFYQEKRFWFSETRLATFATIAATSTYTTTQDTDIPKFLEIDDVLLNDGSYEFTLRETSPADMQRLLSTSSSGTPNRFSYFEETFRLYPVPAGVYTVTPIGHIEIAAPATDGTANNVWMTKAYELIRCRAKAYLSTHVTMDLEMATTMVNAERDAYGQLRRKTAKKQLATATIEATDF